MGNAFQKMINKMTFYIKFLGSKNEETEDPILSVAGCLSGKSLTANEVEEYLYGNIRNDAC
ncbi:MAG: hypothetical protein WCR46_12850 [Deltaproteobacteria bacterium]|jgi:hypothetical protein